MEKIQQMKDALQLYIDTHKDELFSLSRDIWSRPELSASETYAHDRLVCYFSQQQTWTVEKHYKLPTAFRASWGPVGGGAGEAPLNVGFLCEYDALPGIGHACGHNLIAEVGAAAAVGLKAALESQTVLPAPVKVTHYKPGVLINGSIRNRCRFKTHFYYSLNVFFISAFMNDLYSFKSPIYIH